MQVLDFLHDASSSLARLDERLNVTSLAPAVRSWFLTQEARGLSALGGLDVVEREFVSSLDLASSELSSKAMRTAADLRKALALAVEWPGGLDAERIAEILRVSDKSNPKRDPSAAEGLIEGDSIALARLIGNHFSSPLPTTAVETIRRIWNLNGLFSNPRRAALLMAPYLITMGFGLRKARITLAKQFNDHLMDCYTGDKDIEKFQSFAFRRIAEGANRAMKALSEFEGVIKKVEDVVGPRHKGASRIPIVELFCGQPTRSVSDLAKAMDMTEMGASLVVKELMKHGFVVKEDAARGPKRLYVMSRALGL